MTTYVKSEVYRELTVDTTGWDDARAISEIMTFTGDLAPYEVYPGKWPGHKVYQFGRLFLCATTDPEPPRTERPEQRQEDWKLAARCGIWFLWAS
jgi:hypothetical protein